jgi:hypothetical protein
MILVLVFGVTLIALAGVSLDTARTETVRYRTEHEIFQARQAAQAGVNEALALLRDGGISQPMSGDSGVDGGDATDGIDDPEWVQHGPDGAYYYRTDVTNLASGQLFTITSYGRYESGTGATFQQGVDPTDPTYDGTGWTQRAIEVLVLASKGIPEAPLYFGNGGVEKGKGGWKWDGAADPLDSSTWTYYGTSGNRPSGTSSWISPGLIGNDVFSVDSRDHPEDWLDLKPSKLPTLVSETPHPYGIFASQTLVGAHNASTFFDTWTSGSSTHDPNTQLTPSPEGSNYEGDRGQAFPVDTSIPDVQTWSWELWSTYGNDPNSIHIDDQDSDLSSIDGEANVVVTNGGLAPGGGHKTFTIGDIDNPQVVFVTGELNVHQNRVLKGYGILVVRDDFHPDEGGNNTPGVDAQIEVAGRLEWTGLVILAGWHPAIDTSGSREGSGIVVNGALFGEDSVQSGGETALDTAQINAYLGTSSGANNKNGAFVATYSREIFEPGGLIYDLLPNVNVRVLAMRDIE